jgi:subtilase family serine protease
VLEGRNLLSAAADPVVHPLLDLVSAVTNPTPPAGAYTPAQVRHAYGFDGSGILPFASYTDSSKPLPGTGQTIALVEAFHDPHLADHNGTPGDLTLFDAAFGLPAPPTFTEVNQTGGDPSGLSDNSGWSLETTLDVEWAHAIAPGANILVVESKSESLGDMLAAVDYAGQHASVVSMSWGFNEFGQTRKAAGETSYDGHFNAANVTYVAASGDSGKPPIWPSASPNVLSVGGTTATFDAAGTYVSETGWGYGNLSWLIGGSGGGPSAYESRPNNQKTYVTAADSSMPSSVLSGGKRLTPDVAYDSDPNTGFPVYSSDTYQNQSGWFQVGGTSDAAPQWSALIAIANQGRSLLNGNLADQQPLTGNGQTLYALYKVGASASHAQYFHDVTSGNNGYAAGPGYDLVTGFGTPYADQVVGALVAWTGSGATGSFTAAGGSSAEGSAVPHVVLSRSGVSLSPGSSADGPVLAGKVYAPGQAPVGTTPVALLTTGTKPAAPVPDAPTNSTAPAAAVPPAVVTPAPVMYSYLPGGGSVTDDKVDGDAADAVVTPINAPAAALVAPSDRPVAVPPFAALRAVTCDVCIADLRCVSALDAPTAADATDGATPAAGAAALAAVLGGYWSAPAATRDDIRRQRRFAV